MPAGQSLGNHANRMTQLEALIIRARDRLMLPADHSGNLSEAPSRLSITAVFPTAVAGAIRRARARASLVMMVCVAAHSVFPRATYRNGIGLCDIIRWTAAPPDWCGYAANDWTAGAGRFQTARTDES